MHGWTSKNVLGTKDFGYRDSVSLKTRGEKKLRAPWGGENKEFRIKQILTTVYKIDKGVLLYSTGNYIQYLLKTYTGKEYEKYESLLHT